ncbi:MAG: nucleoside hydrolase, partial [bacterium]|nr:nucleoside hydrolase [Candidatus Colisoma equi]
GGRDGEGGESGEGGGGESGGGLTNHLDRAARWYRNFADHKYDPYEYRRKLAWRGRFANLPRTVNYYSQSDNILVNPDPNDPDPDKVFDPNDQEIYNKVHALLVAKLVNGRSIGRGGSKKTGFGFWSFSEKMKGTWLLDVVNDVLTNMLEVAQADAYKCEGGWGENDDYEEKDVFDPANTRFTPFLDERLKTQGMLDILPAETERVRAQHLADAIPAESFAAGANEVATEENVNEESFIGWNPDWPLYEGEDGEGTRTNLWNHSAFREVAFYHTSKFYTSIAAVGKPRVIIDTDLGSSMDDLFAVDLAARMQKAGKLDLMAVMIDRPDKFNPGKDGEFLTFADRYLASLGLGDLPIGKAMMPADSQTSQYVFNPYWTLIYSNNVTGVGLLLPTNRTPDQIESLTNAVVLYRRLLDESPDKSVVVCSTGFLTNLKALMESGSYYEGDDIGSTGLELIAAKVKELRIMGGWFDLTTEPADGAHGAEYNFAGDPAAAKKVVEGWPTPVILSPWEVGLKLDYKTPNVLEDFPPGTFDPVVRAAHIYWPEPLGDDDKNRLWDPATILPLTEGEAFLPLSEGGGISVAGFGKTTFVPDPSSNRCYQVASK